MSTNSAEEYVALAEEFLEEMRCQINDLQIVKRLAHRYPFDHLAHEFIAKALALSDMCLRLIRLGASTEAYGLARTLVECALNLRYITVDANYMWPRSYAFVATSRADRSLWLYFVRKQGIDGPERLKIEAMATERGFTADAESAYKHWSGERSFVKVASELNHPLDAQGTDSDYKKLKRASDYYYLSHFVHCSQTALDYGYYDERDDFLFEEVNVKRSDMISERCVTAIIDHVKQCVGYCLYGMNVFIPSSFDVFSRYRFNQAAFRFERCWP